MSWLRDLRFNMGIANDSNYFFQALYYLGLVQVFATLPGLSSPVILLNCC